MRGTLFTRAQKLVESWLNGNKKYVAGEIGQSDVGPCVEACRTYGIDPTDFLVSMLHRNLSHRS